MIVAIENLNEKYLKTAGEKAVNLQKLGILGYSVPRGAVLLDTAYRCFVTETGLLERISIELARRDMENMRWEELWDASLRIRNLFAKTEFPESLKNKLRDYLYEYSNIPVAVRSSAPGEDSSGASFAGIHESFLDVLGIDSILDHIRLVWASLWSDKALLYREELGLDVYQSSMSVIIQELVIGDVSGVAFSTNPSGGEEVVIEAVRGLNQSLVDGEVEPERFMLEPDSGAVIGYHSHETSASRLSTLHKNYFQGILGKKDVESIFSAVTRLHKIYSGPVDVEWTIRDGKLFLLQVRPVTTVKESAIGENLWESSDKRPWYRSLTKSFSSLKKLQKRIEEEILPGMDEAASIMGRTDLSSLTPVELAREIEKRKSAYLKWHDVYWDELIPFAHGMRLFGQVYNDTIKPNDPYEFTRLLGSSSMISTERNKAFAELIDILRSDPKLCSSEQGLNSFSLKFQDGFFKFLKTYGAAVYEGMPVFTKQNKLVELMLKTACSDYHYEHSGKDSGRDTLESRFISSFHGRQKSFALEILELARSSWKLREDDNLYLAKIESALSDAVEAGRRVLQNELGIQVDIRNPDSVAAVLKGGYLSASEYFEKGEHDEPVEKSIIKGRLSDGLRVEDSEYSMRVRKYTGQPASPGIGVGNSRVIKTIDDIFNFQQGEVLVCDSIDPNITFIVPFASAIVERRGGMLIHGAIIAREYGIPCVTGVEKATQLIKNGSSVVVDGYLGIVTIKEE